MRKILSILLLALLPVFAFSDTLKIHDADLEQRYLEVTGAGTEADPHIPINTSQDFLLQVALGNVPGHKLYTITGRKDSMSTTVLDDLTQIPTTTVAPTPGGIQLEIVSSSTDDDGAPVGTGIRTLDLHYLDSSGLEQEETLILNGTTAVTTVATDINDVQWMHALTVGTGGVAAGNITLRTVGGAGTDYEYITAGGNQSLSARYTIPAGKTGYIVGWQVSANTQVVDFRLRATVERFDRVLIAGVFLFQDSAVLKESTTGWIPMPFTKVPAGAMIKLSGLSAASGGNGGGSFQILLVDD